MTGKKKKKKDGRKGRGDKAIEPDVTNKLADAVGHQSTEYPTIACTAENKPKVEADSTPNLVDIVEPLLSLAVSQASVPPSTPPPVPSGTVTAPTSPFSSLSFSPRGDFTTSPSFVFSAGRNSDPGYVAAAPSIFSAQTTESAAAQNARKSRQNARRREGKCPPSERFGKMGKSRHQILQLAAQEVAFGQGRDPLSLVVSYEENGLRRIVKVPEGSTCDTIVDSSLRQAVAGAALDSAGWQQALNHPKEDSYFAYSTAPEGLTVAKFRDIKGKVLVTPLTADGGLLKLKQEAEKKRNDAEEVLQNVREYLRRLESEGEKWTAGVQHSEDTSPACAHCKRTRNQLQDLLKIVTQPQSVDMKRSSESADVQQSEKVQDP